MKILVVSHLYPDSRNPTHGIWIYRIVKELTKLGNEVIVINPGPGINKINTKIKFINKIQSLFNFKYDRESVFKHIKSYHPSEKSNKFKLKNKKHIPRKCAVENTIKKYDIRNIHLIWTVTSYNSGSSIYEYAKKHNIPLYVTEVSSPYDLEVGDSVKKNLAKKVLEYATKIISISPGMTKQILNNFPEFTNKIEMIWLPTSNFFLNVKQRYNDKNALRILTVGYLNKQKGLKYLIEAVHKLYNEGFNIVWNMCGDGPMRDELKKLIYQNKIDKIVRMHGMIKNHELINFYENSDVFVQPSLHETQGVAIIEAMTAGLPVIYTKCGAPEYYMNERVGIQVEPKNSEHLYNALKYFDKKKYDSDYIKKYVMSIFDEKLIAKQYLDLFLSYKKENIISSI